MYVAESREAAVELMKKDIYTVSGVWDVDNAQVIPVCFLVLLFLLTLCSVVGFVWCVLFVLDLIYAPVFLFTDGRKLMLDIV